MALHRFDALSFGFGALFVLVGLLLLGGGSDEVRMELAGPLVAVALGVLIILAARPRPEPEAEDTADRDAA